MHLSALYRYPLKSAMGERLQASPVDELGLHGDRRWMLVDADSGRFLSQRVLPAMTRLQARWQSEQQLLLSAPEMSPLLVDLPAADQALRSVSVWKDELNVPDAGDAAADWASRLLGRACRLVYVPAHRTRQVDRRYAGDGRRVAFADGFPVLLIGQASLEDLSARVGRPLEMRRFRPNLVIDGSLPYAEDGWRRIRIGEVEFQVVKPCTRCAITTLDPDTGERSVDLEPLATLQTYRRGEKGVMFGQNLLVEGEGRLEVGMPVELLN
ncbi:MULTISPECIES: MOSC domain-containing protein [Pseudomonas]|uniref:MOSC domain-containing protein n=1 Tax=Serpens gallinarum TaxID=2763075 RepID=A0ABR8TLP9_9PSED|nr:MULTISPECIES: MOSC domain-containing protein [Pseudomonas]MBD7976549.1 MOSC domain-containing protein [Serpens gallinarum]MBF0674562.1 MOSC domain-containing protein [Pseudomonas sp.]MBF0675946.1 MOSC domain-containing protein [Pseudomonas sp.]